MTKQKRHTDPLWLDDDYDLNASLGASKTDEELKQLARDMIAGLVFTSDMIKNPNDFAYVFIVLLFLKKSTIRDMEASKITLLYEYFNKANPRSVNGYPTFFSMSMLNKERHEKLMEYYNKMKEALDNL